MSNTAYAVGGLAILTLVMIVALVTVGMDKTAAPQNQFAETAAVQSAG